MGLIHLLTTRPPQEANLLLGYGAAFGTKPDSQGRMDLEGVALMSPSPHNVDTIPLLRRLDDTIYII